jgi:cardiolipin synthase
MQAAFMDNWMKAVGTVLHGEEYFPELPKKGQALAQVFKSSPGEGSESVRLMYLLSIASARHSVRIAAAYFVPDDLSLATLVEASKRGVKIEVILPGKTTDTELTRKASSSRWGKLLEAGIAIFEYQPTMFHCKVMIVGRFLGLRGIDQLRQPLVPPQRRSQFERLRVGFRAGSDPDL